MKEGRQLTYAELIELSTLINRCAEYAIQQTKRTISSRRKPKGSILPNERFDQFFECYCKSSYAQNLSEDYIEHVRLQSSIHIQHTVAPCFENPLLQTVMLPVLFYSLIAQHESNERSVARRSNKLLEAKANKQPELEWKMPDLFKDFAPEYYLDLKKEESFEKVFRTQEKLIKKCNYYDNPFISAELKQTTSLCQNLFGHLHYFDYFDDIARMGSFLCDILKIPENENHNLNTILRMAIVNTFQHTLHGCSFITTKSQDQYRGDQKIPDFSDIFMGYVMAKLGQPYFEDDIAHPVPVYYIGSEDKPDIKGLFQSAANEKHKFTTYYHYLQENFRFDTSDFINVYLDKEILKTYISCGEAVHNFLSANTKLIRLLGKIHAITAEFNDIATVIGFISEHKRGLEWVLDCHNYPSLDSDYDGLMDRYAFEPYEPYDPAYLEEIQKQFTPDMSLEDAVKEFADIFMHSSSTNKPGNPTNS